MKISLMKSKGKELTEISKIYMEEFSKQPYDQKWTFKKAKDKMKFFSKYCDLYSIKIDSQVIGFIVVNSDFMFPGEVAFLEEMAIKEDFQGKGIGTAAIKSMIKNYKKKGFKRFLGMVNFKSKAFSFYKKSGLKLSRTDVLMEKELK